MTREPLDIDVTLADNDNISITLTDNLIRATSGTLMLTKLVVSARKDSEACLTLEDTSFLQCSADSAEQQTSTEKKTPSHFPPASLSLPMSLMTKTHTRHPSRRHRIVYYIYIDIV